MSKEPPVGEGEFNTQVTGGNWETERKEKGLTGMEEVEQLKDKRIKDSRAFKFRSKWLRKRARRQEGCDGKREVLGGFV